MQPEISQNPQARQDNKGIFHQAGNQADTALLESHMGPAQQGGCPDPVCLAHAPGQAAFEEKLLCSMPHTGM